MEILVRQQYSPQQVQRAELKALEFRPSRYTSGSANLDNMIALNKAVLLCELHTRKFSPRKARYRAHPDFKLQRVIGACDVCRDFGLQFLFLNEKAAADEQRKLEKFKRNIEYRHYFNG